MSTGSPLPTSFTTGPLGDIPDVFRLMCDHAPHPLMLLDSTGRLLYANWALCQLVGCTAADCPPHLLGLISPEDSHLVSTLLTAAPQPPTKCQFLHRSGRPIEVHLTLTLLKSPDAGQAYWVGQCVDITEQVVESVNMLASNQHLAQTLEELRTAQQQLVQQERLAAVGQLAAGIAHDFNNILAAILLNADLMILRQTATSADLKTVQVVKQQGQRAAHLVQQLLDFGRRAILERHTLSLPHLLRDMQPLLASALPENIQLQWEINTTDCLVEADPTRIQQMLFNIVFNARDAMPQGGVLTVRLEVATAAPHLPRPLPTLVDGTWAVLTLTDTGMGMSAAVLANMFEPFFTTKSPQGSGLGLSQVYGIVHQHQGHITAHSTEGMGSMFTIYLPAKLEIAPVPIAQPHALAGGDGQTLFLIEDDHTLLAALTDVLESLNYRIVTAMDGATAVSLYQQIHTQVDLIITDVVLPGLSGRDLLQHLLQITPHKPILILTGHELDHQAISLVGEGSWLQKPVSLATLSDAVARKLAG